MRISGSEAGQQLNTCERPTISGTGLAARDASVLVTLEIPQTATRFGTYSDSRESAESCQLRVCPLALPSSRVRS